VALRGRQPSDAAPSLSGLTIGFAFSIVVACLTYVAGVNMAE